jgi:hypothetical protein
MNRYFRIVSERNWRVKEASPQLAVTIEQEYQVILDRYRRALGLMGYEVPEELH